MAKMTMRAWFLAGLVALAAAYGVYQLATASRRAHQARLDAVTRAADARIAADRAAQARTWAAPPKPAAQAKPVKPPKPQGPDVAEMADALCRTLRRAGASTCEWHFKFWSSSYIDATWAIDPKQARMQCVLAVSPYRTPDRPLAGWQLKLFSPLGSGRPMAVCDL